MQIQTSRETIKGPLIKLKESAINFFEEMAGTQRAWEIDKNHLTMEWLNIVENMVKLGFYNNERELLLILEPVISLLDGSNDFTSQDEEDVFKQELLKIEEEKAARKLKGNNGPLDAKISRDKSKRYASNESNSLIIAIKRKIVDILSKIMQIQNDIRLTQFLIEFNKSDDKLIQNPNEAGPEFIYLDEILNNKEVSSDGTMRDACDEKSMNWMKVAFLNKSLDMRV